MKDGHTLGYPSAFRIHRILFSPISEYYSQVVVKDEDNIKYELWNGMLRGVVTS